MLNSIDVYRDCGKRAAKACNQKDIDLFKFEREWFSRALRLEKDQDKQAASVAYYEGFNGERIVPKPEYFK